MSKKKRKDKKSNIESLKSNPVKDSNNTKRTNIIIIAGLLLLTFMLYGNTITHDFALDDDVVFRKNRFVQQGIEGIPDIFSKGLMYGFNGINAQGYRPIFLTNYALEKEFFGNNPTVHHFFNVLLYALCNVFLFVFLSKLLKPQSFLIPLSITLLFAAHPVHTEAIANIKGRDEILSFLFIILTLLFLTNYCFKRKIKLLFASFGCYLLSLLSKENGVILIAIVPLLLHFFTNLKLKEIFKLSFCFVLILGFYLILRNSILDNIAFEEKMEIMNNALMAAQTEADRLATCFVILGIYLKLLFFPHPLLWDYSYNHIPIVNWTNFKPIICLLIYLGLGIYALIKIKKKDPIAFGILFYMIPLSLVSNIFIIIGSTLGERFLFIPSLGFCIAIVFLITRILKINIHENVIKKKTVFLAIIIIASAGYSFKTIDRNFDWKNNYHLFTADLPYTLNSARSHFAVGSEYRVTGENEQNPEQKNKFLFDAINEYKECLKIYQKFDEAWYNMGFTYYLLGDIENAELAYKEALKINPQFPNALINMGLIYFKRNDYDNALINFKKVIEIDKNFGDAYANTGAVYHNLGDIKSAIYYYELGLKHNASLSTVYNNLSKAYNMLGDTVKAEYYFKKLQQYNSK